jgi:ParB family chromosome partitioning protein
MIHHLKIESIYFELVLSGEKTFEVRLDDRNYRQDDVVILKELKLFKYSGREIKADIGYVCRYKQIGGQVVFSLLNVEVLK